jgi:hypothetical protein
VLTQQHLPGLHLDDWLRTGPAQAARNQMGQRLWDWFMHCAFGLGHLHADLHPGNFLFMPDGQLGVLDFGCTRTLSAPFRQGVAQAWSALLQPATPARQRGVLQAYQALGLLAVDLDEAVFVQTLQPSLAPMQDWQIEPLRQPVFDFTHKSPPPAPDLAHQRLLARHMAGVPAEMPAFERAWMGLMHLLTRLGAQVHTRNAWIHGPEEAPPAPPA